MGEIIRTVRLEEADEFQRFLERCYGHGRGFFERHYPDLSRRDEEAARCFLVLERDGRIVSHVGTYPMEIVVGPSRLLCGGIGGVGTLSEERGKGYMSRLMEESVRRMRERGWHLSALWGDRQRYSNFGYETCGVKYHLRINRRSLGRCQVQPVPVEEVDPTSEEVVKRLRELHATLSYRVERPYMNLNLRRYGVRVFLGPDGYLISRKEGSGDLEVQEVVSPTGQEAGLILGALNWTFGSSANVELEPGEGERATRLLQVSNSWSSGPQAMFRIIHWPRLLIALKPLLAERARGLPAFIMAIGCRWQTQVDVATVKWDGERFEVTEGRGCDEYVELDEQLLVALVLGGPHPGHKSLGLFGRLLPVPVHIPSLDHV